MAANLPLKGLPFAGSPALDVQYADASFRASVLSYQLQTREPSWPKRLRGFIDPIRAQDPYPSTKGWLKRVAAVVRLQRDYRGFSHELTGKLAAGELNLDGWAKFHGLRLRADLLSAAWIGQGSPVLGLALGQRLTAARENADLRLDSIRARVESGEVSLATGAAWARQAGTGLLRTAMSMGAATHLTGGVRRVLGLTEWHCRTCPAKAREFKSLAECIRACGGWPGDGSDECHGYCWCHLVPASLASVHANEADDLAQQGGTSAWLPPPDFSVFGQEAPGPYPPKPTPPTPTAAELAAETRRRRDLRRSFLPAPTGAPPGKYMPGIGPGSTAQAADARDAILAAAEAEGLTPGEWLALHATPLDGYPGAYTTGLLVNGNPVYVTAWDDAAYYAEKAWAQPFALQVPAPGALAAAPSTAGTWVGSIYEEYPHFSAEVAKQLAAWAEGAGLPLEEWIAANGQLGTTATGQRVIHFPGLQLGAKEPLLLKFDGALGGELPKGYVTIGGPAAPAADLLPGQRVLYVSTGTLEEALAGNAVASIGWASDLAAAAETFGMTAEEYIEANALLTDSPYVWRLRLPLGEPGEYKDLLLVDKRLIVDPLDAPSFVAKPFYAPPPPAPPAPPLVEPVAPTAGASVANGGAGIPPGALANGGKKWYGTVAGEGGLAPAAPGTVQKAIEAAAQAEGLTVEQWVVLHAEGVEDFGSGLLLPLDLEGVTAGGQPVKVFLTTVKPAAGKAAAQWGMTFTGEETLPAAQAPAVALPKIPPEFLQTPGKWYGTVLNDGSLGVKLPGTAQKALQAAADAEGLTVEEWIQLHTESHYEFPAGKAIFTDLNVTVDGQEVGVWLTTVKPSSGKAAGQWGFSLGEAPEAGTAAAGAATPPPALPGLPPAPPAGPVGSLAELPALDDAILKVDLHAAEPTWLPKPGVSNRYGAVIFDDEGRVLLREPTDHYGGYAWTWPKGTPDHPWDHPLVTARREVGEEVGAKFDVVGLVPGRHSTSSSDTYFFLGRAKSFDFTAIGAETQSAKWVTPQEAIELIQQSPNLEGRARDLKVLQAAVKQREQLLAGQVGNHHLDPTTHQWVEPAHPKAAAPPVVAPGPAVAPSPAVSPPPGAKAPHGKPFKPGPAPEPTVPPPVSQRVQPPAEVQLPDGTALRHVAAQQGSNPAGWYADQQGRRYYVKWPNAGGQVPAELASRRLARLLGLEAPDGELVVLPGGQVAVASPEVAIQTLPGASLRAKAATERAGQLVHAAWTRNWDAVGQDFDNLVVGPNGKLMVVDHGGSLLWRAQGGLKPNGLPGFVEELQTLRHDSGKTAQAAKVWGDITDEQLARAIRKHLKPATDKALTEIVHAAGFTRQDAETILTGLRQRRDSMLEWADGVLAPAKPPAAPFVPTPNRTKAPQPPRGYSGDPRLKHGWFQRRLADVPPQELYSELHQRATQGPAASTPGDASFDPQHAWSGATTSKTQVRALCKTLGFTEENAQIDQMLDGLTTWKRGSHRSPAAQAAARMWNKTAPGYRGQVCRGVGTSGRGAAGIEHLGGRGLVEGQEFTMDRYYSFSTGPGFSADTILVVERNTIGASMRALGSGYYYEDEVLVGGEKVRYRVAKIHSNVPWGTGYDRKTVIVLEEVSPNE